MEFPSVQPTACVCRDLGWGFAGCYFRTGPDGPGDAPWPALVGTSGARSVAPLSKSGLRGATETPHPWRKMGPPQLEPQPESGCPGPSAARGPACAPPGSEVSPEEARHEAPPLPQHRTAHGVLCLINMPGISLSDKEKPPGRPRLLSGRPREPRQEGSRMAGQPRPLWTWGRLSVRDRQGLRGALRLGEAAPAGSESGARPLAALLTSVMTTTPNT